MQKFTSSQTITIVARDIDGERQQVQFYSWEAVADVHAYLTEDDEILIVYVGEACIFSALGRDTKLTLNELMEFFGKGVRT